MPRWLVVNPSSGVRPSAIQRRNAADWTPRELRHRFVSLL
jgi:hypothetical protein